MSPSSTITSPELMPTRNSIRCSGPMPELRSAMLRCTEIAHATASVLGELGIEQPAAQPTTLGNSTSMPSPVVLTRRPLVTTEQEAFVSEASTIGLDLAKRVFQAHGADASGKVVFRKRLRREQVLAFFAGRRACMVAMEACSSAHYWARAIGELGHTVRLIPPAYVKPFVKRQKNDTTDAEAICEAAQRPTMRFVSVKSEAAQANAVVFRARDLLVRQRTQTINALRGHLGEYGVVVAKGPSHVAQLIAHVEDLPEAARTVLRELT